MQKFRDNEEDHRVVQPEKEIANDIAGNWNQRFFENDQPITLEVGCGRGEYTIGMARQFPERNFIGIDIKGSRIWTGARQAEEHNLNNVGFLRIHILELTKYFASNEIAEIWITFPDPRPRDRDERRRLTHPRFLNLYDTILKIGGQLYLKTDDRPLFDYSLEAIRQSPFEILWSTHDLYSSQYFEEAKGIKTRYEEMFVKKGKSIHLLKSIKEESNYKISPNT